MLCYVMSQSYVGHVMSTRQRLIRYNTINYNCVRLKASFICRAIKPSTMNWLTHTKQGAKFFVGSVAHRINKTEEVQLLFWVTGHYVGSGMGRYTGRTRKRRPNRVLFFVFILWYIFVQRLFALGRFFSIGLLSQTGWDESLRNEWPILYQAGRKTLTDNYSMLVYSLIVGKLRTCNR